MTFFPYVNSVIFYVFYGQTLVKKYIQWI